MEFAVYCFYGVLPETCSALGLKWINNSAGVADNERDAKAVVDRLEKLARFPAFSFYQLKEEIQPYFSLEKYLIDRIDQVLWNPIKYSHKSL